MQSQPNNLRLLFDLTKREYRLRYLGSLLGSYWNIVHPIMMIFIYTVIFSQVMKARLGDNAGGFSYSIYLCSGIIAWNLLSEVVNRCTVTLIDNASFLKKLSFSPLILFGATTASALINFFTTFSIFLAVLFFIYPIPLINLLLYLAVVGLLTIFATMLGIAIGCLNVFMRDFQQLTNVVFQLWFWFTPIVYLTNALPDLARKLLWFNPAFVFIEPLHQLMYFKVFPEWQSWALMLVWVFVSAAISHFIYWKTISYVRDHL